MTEHLTRFKNSGSSGYSFASSRPRFRLSVPPYSEIVSAVPEEIYPALMQDIGQQKYSHIQVFEQEDEKPEKTAETQETQADSLNLEEPAPARIRSRKKREDAEVTQ